MSNTINITLEDGEKEKIITERDAQDAIPYILEVVGSNPVRAAHSKRYAEDGATLASGIPHNLSRFRGDAVWIAAYDGPSEIRVVEAGVDVQAQPPKGVQIEGDVSIGSEIDITDDQTREIGKARLMDSGGVLVDPPTESKQDQIISLLEDIKSNTAP